MGAHKSSPKPMQQCVHMPKPTPYHLCTNCQTEMQVAKCQGFLELIHLYLSTPVCVYSSKPLQCASDIGLHSVSDTVRSAESRAF